jgi:hypothetical protein
MAYKISPIPHANILSTITQNYTGLTSGQTIHYNTIYDINSGITLTENSKINFQSPGDYLINVVAIMCQSATNNVYYNIWFQKNGIDIPNSNLRLISPIFGNEYLINNTIILDVNVNDYILLRWQSSSANGRLFATTGLTGPTRPDVASVRLMINKMSE